MHPDRTSELHFAVCVRNDDYPASLETRKIYQILPDADAASEAHVRVIDESGEDYLYPESYLVEIGLPREVETALLRAS